jgi:hypothetical protein
MIDFPASPTENQMFQAPGGPRYVYSNGGWRMSDPGPPGTAQTRNRIVNGAMQISQENGNTAVNTDNAFPADQWKLSFGGGGVLSGQRVQVVTPNGSQNRLRLGVATADVSIAAGDHYEVMTALEGIRVSDFRWGTAQARQAVLRFGFRGPAGVYTARMGNALNNRSYPVNFTISAGQANLDTEQVFVIPGDTTGTWAVDNTIGVVLTLNFAAGTTFQGAANTWGAGNFFCTAAASNMMATTSNVFELYDVGLYLDPLATGVAPPWQMPDEAQELMACQRYWQKFYSMMSGYAASPGFQARTGHSISPSMRTTPAFSFVVDNGNNATGPTGWIFNPTSFSCYAINAAAGWYGINGYSTLTARM